MVNNEMHIMENIINLYKDRVKDHDSIYNDGEEDG